MKYMIDSANCKNITILPIRIEGITTNPELLKEVGVTPDVFLNYSKRYDILKFIQVKSTEEIKDILENHGDDKIVFKIPMVDEGFKLYESLRKTYSTDVKIAGTFAYDIIQINEAMIREFDYSMVYVHKTDEKYLLEQAVELKNKKNSKIQLIAASFRDLDEIKRAIMSGVDYATIKPHLLNKLFTNQKALDDWNNFL